MDLQDLADNYGRDVSRWPDFAQRDGIAGLFEDDVSWLCDAFDTFNQSQFRRMVVALQEPHTSARLIALGIVLDELLTAPMLLDELQKRVDLMWSGWRRDRYAQEARA